jgi:hypothetical protein
VIFSTQVPESAADTVSGEGAGRMLVMGGIALILAGMIFGDIFAAFTLHPNADRIGASLSQAADGVARQDRAEVAASFANIGDALENHGTKVDAHLHIVAFGYIAFALALLQPIVALSPAAKRRLAVLFLSGATLLPIGVFLIHYVGLWHSPFAFIGWASLAADFGGLLVIVACVGELAGIVAFYQKPKAAAPLLRVESGWAARTLLAGGTLLVLAGFVFGSYYAAFDLYPQEAQEISILTRLLDGAAHNSSSTAAIVQEYGLLQADKAVKIAAHAHFIEFGVSAFLLAFIQPYVFLRERWKNRWTMLLLSGSIVLPVFVPLELRLGLLAGGIADIGGLMVIVALVGMLVGVVRHTGKIDATQSSHP